MKKFFEKILDKYFEYKISEAKKINNDLKTKDEVINPDKVNLDDFDDWTEDEAEDLLTWGKTDLLHN